ncbi:helicase-associated domain-containing protein [uncultured Arthrobacter sp.]|uniref:helicase-associated domain-containing protein n=1 Tax=uncultured Arthrobacter sp. TaxID=114050 RepID=UPI00260D4945|nr:helicase-associated domain-containing protein [uncultured Arthrobacter sp.]
MSAIRALAEDLASRSDAELRTLMAARPDIVLPPVPDFAALAARASTRVSVQRALEALNTPQLMVLEAMVLTTDLDAVTGSTAASLKTSIASPAKTLEPYLAHLHDVALLRTGPVLKSRRSYFPLETLHDALGPYPAGLGRPLSALTQQYPHYGERILTGLELLAAAGISEAASAGEAGADPATALAVLVAESWDAVLESAPGKTADLLQKLAASPVGSAKSGAAATPLEWLLDHGLLIRLDANHVELPREVGIAARGGVIFPNLPVSPPVPHLATVRISLRDNAAFGAIAETLRLITELLTSVQAEPIATLRTGGVGVREIRRLADTLRVEREQIAWLLELAALARLLTLDPDSSRWMGAADGSWHLAERSEQWLRLVRAWLDAERAPSLVGGQLPTGSSVNVLSSEATRTDAPAVRRRTLSAAVALSKEAEHDDGRACVLDAPSLIARLTWQQPRLRRRFTRLVPGMVEELGHLGLLGSGALTDLGAAIAQDQYDDAVSTLRDALPEPLTHFVLQADLTAVAPGYLEPQVARELALLASAEGQGPATVYRFSAQSVRRALDDGQDAAAILAFLEKHSATDVPQPLRYLVEDTASRYGSLRVGHAYSYVRSDDDAALTALLADPAAAALGLVRLAPTVVTAQATPVELASALRELGYSPALEGGAAPRPPSRTAGSAPSSSAVRTNPWVLTEEDAAAQMKVLRGSARPGSAAGAEGEAMIGLETLRTAIRTKQAVRLGFADGAGNSTRQVFVPLSVQAGRVRVFDPEKETERVISVHRIMDVETVEGASTDA